MHTTCEICKSSDATMLLYAKNPGVQQPPPQRNDNPFYPYTEADIAINVCTDCFHDMATSMRDDKYTAIRATGVIPHKAPYNA